MPRNRLIQSFVTNNQQPINANRWKNSVALSALALALAACSGSIAELEPRITNSLPLEIASTVEKTIYDGTTNDLLTGGLGKTGLSAATAPAFADPNNPTPTELRTRAIYNNYRALVDMTPAGGFGVLYGPNLDADGKDTRGEGKIAGEEYLAITDLTIDGFEAVTLMVQVPSNFNPDAPCIIAAPSSGSRGVYGAIATAGEWGLKKGCAVAYTDKGTGNGAHDLSANVVYKRNGQRVSLADSRAGDRQFGAGLTTDELAKFNADTPNRWAMKHAHLRGVAEASWGDYVRRSINFAFYVLNEKYGDPAENNRKFRKFFTNNTLVIASSVSNGGGASLAALERDTGGLIDGVAVAEPQLSPSLSTTVSFQQGATKIENGGKALVDYTTHANLFQPCAALAASLAAAPGRAFVNTALAEARCTTLAEKKLLDAASATPLPDQALAKMRGYGWSADSDLLHASHYAFATPAIAVTYTTAASIVSVKDNLCGFSFGATAADGTPTALSPAAAAGLFGNGNGIPPTAGINIINNNSLGGAKLDSLSVSANGVSDYNFPGAFCLREIVKPVEGVTYVDPVKTAQAAYLTSLNAVSRTGAIGGKPVIIVHGRNDALVPVNHSSRPYVAQSRAAEGSNSKLSYIEVTNAQHFDAFNGNAALAGFDTRYIPLHVYFNRAMDALWDNLRNAKALPPSQVIRTLPRGGTAGQAPAITAANVPAFAATPRNEDAIKFENNVLTIPE